MHCNTLQHTATHCTAYADVDKRAYNMHCNTLQHTALHMLTLTNELTTKVHDGWEARHIGSLAAALIAASSVTISAISSCPASGAVARACCAAMTKCCRRKCARVLHASCGTCARFRAPSMSVAVCCSLLQYIAVDVNEHRRNEASVVR